MTKIVATFLTAILFLSMTANCEEVESVLGEVVIPDTGDNIDTVTTVNSEEAPAEPTQDIAETESINQADSEELVVQQETAPAEVETTLAQIVNNEADVKEPIENLVLPHSENSKFAILVISGAVVIIGLLMLSIYYRGYLARHRRPPFEAPAVLRCLFPKPINYEHEITVLCSKYLNN